MTDEPQRVVIEFPAINRTAPHRADLRPSRFERTRVSLARYAFLHMTLVVRLAIWLVPRSHPWAILTRSAFEDWRALTHTGLRPRTKEGVVVSRDDLVTHDRRRSDRWRWLRRTLLVVWAALSVWLLLNSLSFDGWPVGRKPLGDGERPREVSMPPPTFPESR